MILNLLNVIEYLIEEIRLVYNNKSLTMEERKTILIKLVSTLKELSVQDTINDKSSLVPKIFKSMKLFNTLSSREIELVINDLINILTSELLKIKSHDETLL